MNTNISPRVARIFALSVLIVLLWAIMHMATAYISGRLELANDIRGLQRTYDELSRRRVDIGGLKRQMATLLALPSVRRSAIVATSERDAVNQLMQTTRQSLVNIKGHLLLLTEDSGNHTPTLVAVEMRARMEESALPRWLSLVDGGQVRPRVQDLSISSQHQASSGSKELEIAATLTASWGTAEERRR